MNRPKLDDLEQQIEDEAHRYVPMVGEERSRVERVLEKSRKTRSINIHDQLVDEREITKTLQLLGRGTE